MEDGFPDIYSCSWLRSGLLHSLQPGPTEGWQSVVGRFTLPGYWREAGRGRGRQQSCGFSRCFHKCQGHHLSGTCFPPGAGTAPEPILLEAGMVGSFTLWHCWQIKVWHKVWQGKQRVVCWVPFMHLLGHLSLPESQEAFCRHSRASKGKRCSPFSHIALGILSPNSLIQRSLCLSAPSCLSLFPPPCLTPSHPQSLKSRLLLYKYVFYFKILWAER